MMTRSNTIMNKLVKLTPAETNTASSDRIETESDVTSTRLKLIRDAIGGVRLATENGELLENVFVKGYERVVGSITRLELEVIYVTNNDSEYNW